MFQHDNQPYFLVPWASANTSFTNQLSLNFTSILEPTVYNSYVGSACAQDHTQTVLKSVPDLHVPSRNRIHTGRTAPG